VNDADPSGTIWAMGDGGGPRSMFASSLRHVDLPLDTLGASLFDASEDCITVVGVDGRMLAMNANGVRLTEIGDFDALAGGPWSALWPSQHHRMIHDALAQVLRTGAARFTADRPTGSGNIKWWEVVLCPMFEDSGPPTRVLAISRDITDRLRIEEEKALLARELAHRIRNMFSVVNGVISLSARSAGPELRPFADALRERLTGLWRAISYVSPPELSGIGHAGDHSLIGLLHVLLAPYGDLDGAARRVTIAGDDLPIGRAATTPLALIANELATNALKYGALGQPDGGVTVATQLAMERVRITWTEFAPALNAGPREPVSDGFGSVLLEKAVGQLGGRMGRRWLTTGLEVQIDLAVDRLGRHPGEPAR